jgi:hypothetical protein
MWQYDWWCVQHAAGINPLNAKLNPICHLLALLGAHPILHVSRIRVKLAMQYQKFLHKNFKQYLIICLPGVQHVCILKQSLPTLTLTHGKLYFTHYTRKAMPDRSRVMTQTKRDTLVLQVGGWA